MGGGVVWRESGWGGEKQSLVGQEGFTPTLAIVLLNTTVGLKNMIFTHPFQVFEKWLKSEFFQLLENIITTFQILLFERLMIYPIQSEYLLMGKINFKHEKIFFRYLI